MTGESPLGNQVGRGGGLVLSALTVLSLMVNVADVRAQAASAGLRPGGLSSMPTTLRWGPQRPDLLRFNRVEAVSIGARAQVRPTTWAGPTSITVTARLGVADLEPNARIDVASETLRRRLTASGFNELTAIDPEARHLGVANSTTALLGGRDDGDYFYRTGVGLEWTSPSAERRTFRVGAYAEYHRSADVEHSFTLPRAFDETWRFRPNFVAAEVWEVGVLAGLSPWWGSDPRLLRGGLDLEVRAATGGADFARASLTGVVVTPLGASASVTVEASAGTTWGSPAPQRLFYVGGAGTLRGYVPMTMNGTSFGTGRVEVVRTFPFGGLVLFSDAGWAGDRSDVTIPEALFSVGAGVALVDGLIRADVARTMRAPHRLRLDLYLDSMR